MHIELMTCFWPGLNLEAVATGCSTAVASGRACGQSNHLYVEGVLQSIEARQAKAYWLTC